MNSHPIPLAELNELNQTDFVAICGPFFEHSPWIAERTWPQRPFATRGRLLAALLETLTAASDAEKMSLICAHPDLVGRLAQAGQLTRESTGEQASAGLNALSPDEIAKFQEYNSKYREKFAFPFVICARENKKEAILAAFPVRLNNTAAQEQATALAEIGKIAKLRLWDAILE